MSPRTRYPTSQAFRMALEQRLRTEAAANNLPLDRLRKEAAFNRMFARLRHVAPETWALKGGLALIARVSIDVRGTRDADLNWRSSRQDLEQALSEVEELDLADWFYFAVGDGRTMQGEGDEGALRFHVTARLDGRVFERFSLDLNLVGSGDPRPVELVAFRRNPFDFVGEPVLEIPMVRPEHQLAEKLHAYSRSYREGTSSRAKDLFDMLVIADQLQLPEGSELISAVQETFGIRATPWPPALAPPPPEWERVWLAMVADYPLPWANLAEAFAALQRFWDPVLAGAVHRSGSTWQPDAWQWISPAG